MVGETEEIGRRTELYARSPHDFEAERFSVSSGVKSHNFLGLSPEESLFGRTPTH